MGSLPYEPHPHDDTKGGRLSPLDSPAGHPNVLSNDGYFRGALLRNMYPFKQGGSRSNVDRPAVDQMTKT